MIIARSEAETLKSELADAQKLQRMAELIKVDLKNKIERGINMELTMKKAIEMMGKNKENLDISYTAVTSLPDNLKVGGKIFR